MKINATFCDVEDLEEITGLTREELWHHNFNLDDCDGVMILDEQDLPLEFIDNGEYEQYWQPVNDLWSLYCDNKINTTLYHILDDWDSYCVGSYYTKYNGKVYVSKHHA